MATPLNSGNLTAFTIPATDLGRITERVQNQSVFGGTLSGAADAVRQRVGGEDVAEASRADRRRRSPERL